MIPMALAIESTQTGAYPLRLPHKTRGYSSVLVCGIDRIVLVKMCGKEGSARRARWKQQKHRLDHLSHSLVVLLFPIDYVKVQ
jgi:hypothetical protein